MLHSPFLSTLPHLKTSRDFFSQQQYGPISGFESIFLLTFPDLLMLGIFACPSSTYIFTPLWSKTSFRRVNCYLIYTFLILLSIPVAQFPSETVNPQEFPDMFNSFSYGLEGFNKSLNYLQTLWHL